MRRMNRPVCNGFTLIEVIFALFILGLVGVVMLNGYRSSISSASIVRENTAATTIAKQAMEGLKQFEAGGKNDDYWKNTYIPKITGDAVNYPVTMDNVTYPRRISFISSTNDMVCLQVEVDLPHWDKTVTFRSYFSR